MMDTRIAALSVLAPVLFAACGDSEPTTAVPTDGAAEQPAAVLADGTGEQPAAAHAPAAPVPAAGLAVEATGTVEGGGTFDGRLRLQDISLDADGDLVASGEVTGQVTTPDGGTRGIRETFENVPVTTLSANGEAVSIQQEGCEIVAVSLGPIEVSTPLLNVTLSEISAEITVDDAGLVGGLLCTVIGLI